MSRKNNGHHSRTLTLQAGVSLEAAGDGPRRITIEAYDGGIIAGCNLAGSFVIDLAGLNLYESTLPIHRDHDTSVILGHAANVNVTTSGITVDGVLSGTAEVVKEVLEPAENGFPWRASVGVTIDRVQQIRAGKSVSVNGQEFQGPLVVVKKSSLREVSIVATGANRGTSVSLAAMQNLNERIDMDFEKWLAARCIELKLDKDSLTDFEHSTLKAEYEAQPKVEPKDEPKVDLNARREELCRMYEREAELKNVLGDHPDLMAKAVKEDWSADRAKTELELAQLKASRAQVPAFHITGNADSGVTQPQVLECALAQTLGVADLETQFGERQLDAAHTNFRNGVGLQELLLNCALTNGYSGNRFFARDDASLHQVLKAAFSTNDISGILGNTANKVAAASFNAVEGGWSLISKITNVQNFQTLTSYRLTANTEYERVDNGGKIPHGTLGEASYTVKADTYGRMLVVSRQDIINDNISALSDLPAALGRGGALAINKYFWTDFMDNSSFFTASAPVNYISGATTNLSAAGLKTAKTAFEDLVDEDGNPMGISPKYLLVPNALEITANQLMNSTEIRETAGAATTGTANPYQSMCAVLRSSYLGNSNYTGYSTLAWYLIADPADVAVMEVAFLNGNRMPTISRSDADFDTLGIKLRGVHDFGVSKREPRAGLKSKGEA